MECSSSSLPSHSCLERLALPFFVSRLFASWHATFHPSILPLPAPDWRRNSLAPNPGEKKLPRGMGGGTSPWGLDPRTSREGEAGRRRGWAGFLTHRHRQRQRERERPGVGEVWARVRPNPRVPGHAMVSTTRMRGDLQRGRRDADMAERNTCRVWVRGGETGRRSTSCC